MIRLFFLILAFGTAFIHAQQENRIGLLPSFNLRYSINEEWKTNMKIESRFLQIDMKHDSSDFQFYNLTDISLFIGKKIRIDNNFAAGYLFRTTNDGRIIHRFIQQFTTVQSWRNIKSAQRIRLDQTISAASFTYRVRYRYGVEIPLNGESIDIGESYILAHSEAIFSYEISDQSIEGRLSPLIGWKLNNRGKFEIGPEIRVNRNRQKAGLTSNWLVINYYFTI